MSHLWRALAGCFAVGLLVGCGSGDMPDLGEVSGKVTLDGKPLAGVIITFQPDAGGRASSAETDTEGNYELIYKYGVNGAKVGSNTVSFAWPMGAEAKQAIPGKYQGKTDLKADVKGGSNEYNWELKSK